MSDHEYIDFAEYYDFDHALTVDIYFYLDYARQCGSPILELACGTGRVTIPIAQTGFEVYGIDVSENMLDVCRRAVDEHGLEDRVHLSQADMAGFDLPRKEFALVVIALRSFMHLLTRDRQQACLQSIRQHLRPSGSLVIDVIAPEPERLEAEPDEFFAVVRQFDLPDGNHVVRKQRLATHDRANQVRRFEFLFEEFDGDGKLVNGRLVPLWTRYVFYDEMIELLKSAGFFVNNVFRDFERNPYDGTGEMIFVATL